MEKGTNNIRVNTDDILRFLDSIVENIPHMIFVKDARDLRFVRFNKAGEYLIGLEREALIGKTDYDIFPREQADFFTAKDREVLASGQILDVSEEPLETRKGLRYLHTKKIPILDDNGNPIYLLGISEDITELKKVRDALNQAHADLEMRVKERTTELSRTNQELREEIESRRQSDDARIESERKLITLLGNLPGMAYRCLNDPQWTMEFVSEGALELTGYKPEDLIFNKTISYMDLIHPSDRDRVWGSVQEGLKNRTSFTMEYRMITASGMEKFIWERGVGVYAPSGVLRALEGFATDITERVLYERELLMRREEQQIIFDAVPAMVWYKDGNNRILRCNRLAAQSLGLLVSAVEGRPMEELFPNFAAKALADDREVMASGQPKLGTVEQLDFPGKPAMWIRTDKIPYRDAAGQIIGVVVFCLDVTEQLWAEEELKKITAELSRSNRDLEQFAFIASHDLKEPVRKIENFADLLIKQDLSALNPESRDYVARMHQSAHRMALLIEDLLQYSRLTMGNLNFVEVDLNEILDHVLSDLELIIRHTGAEFEREPLPVVSGNRAQMLQLFLNLVGNALKFHHKDNRPRIRISCPSRENGYYTLQVADNGIGFDPKFSEQVFLPFQRLHNRMAYEGTGIGLALCRKIVEHHRGSIAVETEPGKGSVFTVKIPIQPSQAPAS